MKKIGSIALAALLALSLTAGLTSCASGLGDEGAINNYVPTVLTATTESGGVITFEETEGNTVKVVSYEGKKLTDDTVKIPNEINEKPVTAIGEKAFYGLSSVVGVELPDTLLSIDPFAFAGCTGLLSVTLPASVTTVADYAFQGCAVLKTVDLGDSVTSLGDYAFWGCKSLETIEFPDSLKTIGTAAFWNCSALKTLDTNMVESIGTFAFYNCSALETISLRDALTHMGEFEKEGSKLKDSLFVGVAEDEIALLEKIDETAYTKDSVAYRYVETMIKGEIVEDESETLPDVPEVEETTEDVVETTAEVEETTELEDDTTAA